MSVTNTSITTNRVIAGTASIGTLNSGSLNIRSGTISLTNLESNSLNTNNIYVSGDLSSATITEILSIQSDLSNDVYVNQFRIADISADVSNHTDLITGLSNEITDLNQSIAQLDLDDFDDLSARVFVNEGDISDLSGRINDIVVGEGLVTRIEFTDLSQEVTSNTNILHDLSDEVEILRTGFVTEARLNDLSDQVRDNYDSITDLCDGVAQLIGTSGGGEITNQEFIDLSNRVRQIEVDTSNILAMETDISDLSGRLTYQESRLEDISDTVDNLQEDVVDISDDLERYRNTYFFSDNKIGLRVDPSNEEFIVNYTISEGTVDVSEAANIVIGLSSDAIVVNGNTTFRGQVQFEDRVSIPANTILIDTSGVTNIDFLSTTPYSHTDYIMFDTSELNALEYYGNAINPDSVELHLRFSKLSKSRNIFISCPPACMKRLVFELYDDDDLSESTIVRMEGNILVQPGAVPIGYNGLLEDVSSTNAHILQDYSSDPYRYLYDLCDNRGNMGRFFYTQAVVVPRDDVSNYVGIDHPNATGNRMDISFYPDVSGDLSGFELTERYHRYYQTGSYQFNVEYVSTGVPHLRNRAHMYVRETARTRPLRYAERTNNNVELSQSSEDQLQLLVARLLFTDEETFQEVFGAASVILGGGAPSTPPVPP
jgi:predicted  nucleic acid-binding Zn-ribbon protein